MPLNSWCAQQASDFDSLFGGVFIFSAFGQT